MILPQAFLKRARIMDEVRKSRKLRNKRSESRDRGSYRGRSQERYDYRRGTSRFSRRFESVNASGFDVYEIFGSYTDLVIESARDLKRILADIEDDANREGAKISIVPNFYVDRPMSSLSASAFIEEVKHIFDDEDVYLQVWWLDSDEYGIVVTSWEDDDDVDLLGTFLLK